MTDVTVGSPPVEALDPDAFRATAVEIRKQVEHVIVGQAEAVQGVLICLIANGHALLEGAFAEALNLSHNRVQFTPDLMPADITGTTVFTEEPTSRRLVSEFHPGPVFSSLLLADEINRASPRTQSALLEAMQEGTVTVAGETHPLPRPFCVLATQNPVEMHGTYPLPEAQLDRFLLKLRFDYPSGDELLSIMSQDADAITEIELVADANELIAMNALARQVPASTHVLEQIAAVIIALQPTPDAPQVVRDYVRRGPGPRGAQALSLAGRITALLDGRHNLAVEDIRTVAFPALRHRLVLNFDAEREAVTPETVIAAALEQLTDG
jgi:MoxR-like ATPase